MDERAESEANSALANIRKGIVYSQGGAKEEARYADAHRRMGTELKRKYRVGKQHKKVR